jgi:hypothetical protein
MVNIYSVFSKRNTLINSDPFSSSFVDQGCYSEFCTFIYIIFIYTGKPSKLESKFRLTYSMILNLFRVEKISIEGMMSHSFKEFGFLSHQTAYEKELKVVNEKMKEVFSSTRQQEPYWKALSDFYDLAAEFLRLWSDVRVCTMNKSLLTSQKCKNCVSFLEIV